MIGDKSRIFYWFSYKQVFFCCSSDFTARWFETFNIIICLLFNRNQTVDDVPIDLLLTQTWIHFRWRRKKCNRPKGSNMHIKMITFFLSYATVWEWKTKNDCLSRVHCPVFKLHKIFFNNKNIWMHDKEHSCIFSN